MFDDFSEVYEAMIDWPKRLAHETPFYRRWFERAKVKSVVDTACGLGRHAAMFHDWGMCVEGADLSPTMIERARNRFGESPSLRWGVRSFDAPIPVAEPVDCVLCTGNSLALASDMAVAERAIGQMMAAVRQGGIVIIQVQNLWNLPDGPCIWQKKQRASLRDGDVFILKGMHRCGARGYLELAVVPLSEGQSFRSETVSLLGFESTELAGMAQKAGAAEVQCFGGYDEQPYSRDASPDLILVARK